MHCSQPSGKNQSLQISTRAIICLNSKLQFKVGIRGRQTARLCSTTEITFGLICAFNKQYQYRFLPNLKNTILLAECRIARTAKASQTGKAVATLQ